MKPIHVIFGLLLLMAGIILFILFSDVPINAAGQPHGEIAGMMVGGDGLARLATIGDAPYWFQMVMNLLIPALLYIGVPQHRRSGAFVAGLVACATVTIFVWHMLYSSYMDFLITGETAIAFGFPEPTNWKIWGIWLSMMTYNVLYVVAFRRFFLHPDDEAAFEKLVQELRNSEPQQPGLGGHA